MNLIDKIELSVRIFFNSCFSYYKLDSFYNASIQLLDTGAYGSGRTGQSFDVIEYARKPRTWIRGLCLLFSLFTVTAEFKTEKGDDDCLFGSMKICSILKESVD